MKNLSFMIWSIGSIGSIGSIESLGVGNAACKVAIVTGGARGVGSGITEVLASEGYDLVIGYNTRESEAETHALHLQEKYSCKTVCVGGDLADPKTSLKYFKAYDDNFASGSLAAVVHNAGQYIGLTSENNKHLLPKRIALGDGSLVNESEMNQMKYYQALYGDAFVRLCELAIPRMTEGGCMVGLSSPGCTLQYRANFGYDLPGSGKCIMEYAMRIIALKCAKNKIRCNVVIPGVCVSDAWKEIAKQRKSTLDATMESVSGKVSPMGITMNPVDVGNIIAFLCSDKGRFITGVSLAADTGIHLK